MTKALDRPRRGHFKLGFLLGLISGGILALVRLAEAPAEPAAAPEPAPIELEL